MLVISMLAVPAFAGTYRVTRNVTWNNTKFTKGGSLEADYADTYVSLYVGGKTDQSWLGLVSVYWSTGYDDRYVSASSTRDAWLTLDEK